MSERLTDGRLAEIRDEVDSLHLFIEEPACYHCAVHDLMSHIDAQQAEINRLAGQVAALEAENASR